MAKVQDPVCKMMIDDHAELHTTHEGKEYYFCGPACKFTFEESPGEYVGGGEDKSKEPNPENKMS